VSPMVPKQFKRKNYDFRKVYSGSNFNLHAVPAVALPGF
jgi:hypothetical protein